VLFNACSFVAGGPEPQEGGGLGQAQTSWSKLCLWHHRPDEAPACVEGTVATKEQFCFVLVDCIVKYCQVLVLSSIHPQYEAS